MKQSNWEYFDESSRRYLIGLLHGQESGHVVILVNGKITFIDFKVFEPKIFRILIQNVPIQIIIEKEKEKYSYDLKVDLDSPTPDNIARKANKKKHKLQTLIFIGVFVHLIAVLVWYFS